LATRIPKELHRRLRVFCVTEDVVLMHFVVAAIEEKLVAQGVLREPEIERRSP
jgi:hypothetical protein